MASLTIESHKETAEVHYGDEVCKQKIQEKLKEFELPNGLLPVEDVIEAGFDKATGFVWVKQKKSVQHLFQSIDRFVSYGEEITGFIEKRKLKKVTGVEVKELLIWVKLGEIYIDENDPETLGIKTAILGITRTFPVSAFLLNE